MLMQVGEPTIVAIRIPRIVVVQVGSTIVATIDTPCSLILIGLGSRFDVG